MLTVRPLDEQGNWQYKTEKEYLCVRNGEERGFTAAEFKAAQADGWEKQYPYKIGRKKVYMPPLRSREARIRTSQQAPEKHQVRQTESHCRALEQRGYSLWNGVRRGQM